ncbi:MAG: hypothetical protein M3Z06_11670, partial [Actinomycetota bacterium]|nr:hypothetical protein [Actinomycetota bacterium]
MFSDSVRLSTVRTLIGVLGSVLVIGSLLAGTAGAAPAPTRYYLSLGDSLATGTQPDVAGRNHPTGQGYVDMVGAYVRQSAPGLRLVKLGGGGGSTRLIAGRSFA